MTGSRGEEIKRWVRALTIPLARAPLVPERIEARVGRGLHLIIGAAAVRLHIGLSPAGDTPAAARRIGATALSLLGDGEVDAAGRAWFESVCRVVESLAERPDWHSFLRWAADRPAVALPQIGAPAGPVSSGDALLLRIVGRCNAACDFCSARGILPDLVEGEQAVRDQLQAARRRGVQRVSFTGGEPTLDRRLEGYVALAKGLGFERIDLQTNGVLLARPGRVGRLRDAGLDSVFLSLHAAQPALHDRMLKLDGAFERAVAAAEACQAAGLDLALNNVITTQNIDDLVAYVEFGAARFKPGGCEISLSLAAPQGWCREHPELWPALPHAAEQLERALARAEQLGLRARIPGLCGVPMCLLPQRLEHFEEFHASHPPRLADRCQLPQCQRCPLRQRCSGFWTAYLERHGTSPLGPRAFEGLLS
jgi:pyruvate-formate lyase-activating enzyme